MEDMLATARGRGRWPRRVLALGLLGGSCASGCAGAPFIDHLAGEPLASAPDFHHREVFVEGEDLWVAVDPGRYPTKVGQSYRVYVVAHKDYQQWKADPSLSDVSGGFETATLGAGGLSSNKTLAWANMSRPAATHVWHTHYDVCFDFNANGVWDENEDVLDRIGVVERPGAEESGGFTLVEDPIAAGDFPVSTHEYDLGSFSVVVPGAYSESGDPKTIQLIGRMFYPATSAGVDQPISTDFDEYPFLLIAHGRHGGAANSYQGYDYLGQHLASRGFVVASVALHQLVSGWRIHHRGVTILEHVERVVLGPTSDPVINAVRTRLDPGRVGLLGHSRGGEGVVAAQEIHSGLTSPGYSIRGVASFSPTDGSNWNDSSPSSGPYDPLLPYLMIYPSRDGDVRGVAGNTGFRIHDRGVRPRHLVNIHGANHNFFNTTWGSDGSPTITRAEQETLAKALVTPFFSNHLFDQQAYVELLSGFCDPTSVTSVGTIVQFSDQPGRWVQWTLDDGQDLPATPSKNSFGEDNSAGGLSNFTEESLRYRTVPSRNYYTHDTDGLRVAWTSSGGNLGLQTGGRNVRLYDFLSFRVGQRYRTSGHLNSGNQDFSVSLYDTHDSSSPRILVSNYATLYPVDNVGTYTKSAMQTVRIPLRAFTANGSPLDLSSLAGVKFEFDQRATGELLIDDVEFLGLDLTEPD